ncbi:hypothetical protein E2C01_040426 [Portunus trituberculatus]|uniref:Uncharacterized protein n=1 Tax=Portunus trituberculatus TaxID=210409 RepID=A0A5B7FGM9_PORTR|nr:hypothetical protein [Portunus trituberculatus]
MGGAVVGETARQKKLICMIQCIAAITAYIIPFTVRIAPRAWIFPVNGVKTGRIHAKTLIYSSKEAHVRVSVFILSRGGVINGCLGRPAEGRCGHSLT